MSRRAFSLLTIAIALTAASFFLLWQRSSRTIAQQPASAAQALYQKNCAACHGAEGRGDGAAAYLLNPKPRNFRAGKFRLVTSQNLQPTRDDIFRTITNGMPGTGMPSWEQLPENDRRSLADHVLQLNYDGYLEQALKRGKEKRAAAEFAKEMSTPDQPIPIPPEPPLHTAGLEEGRQFYITNCSKCHGEQAEGKRDPTWFTSEGFPTSSRNLREGVFKGGRDGTHLYLRFRTGLPGTPMPSMDVPGETVWRIVQYVQSLSDPAAQQRATLKSVELTAQRVPRLPSHPDNQLWENVPEVRLQLMPLWWIAGHINEVMVKIVHDGQRIAFLLRWRDPTHDIEGVRQQSFPDGAAIQFADALDPPFFGMAEAGTACNIWHWKALWDEDRRSFYDVATAFPNLAADAYFGAPKGWSSGPFDDSAFIPARRLENPVARGRNSSVEEANAAGFGTYTAQAPGEQNVEGASSWKDGLWRLSFARELASSKGQDVLLRPGEKVSVAFAIWQGSAAERNGQKTVSIWNTLKIE
jgi:mono/diheme cytochrome c family protein